MADAGAAAIIAATCAGLLVVWMVQHMHHHHRALVASAAPAATRTRLPLKIEALYIYPVKGLRGCSVASATIGPLGFEHDRTFCLLKVHRDPATRAITHHEAMYSGHNLRTVLFSTAIDRQQQALVITWTGPAAPSEHMHRQLRVPLRPRPVADDDDAPLLTVDMHGAATAAHDMGAAAAAWFARYLGFEARLVYLGAHSRPVRSSSTVARVSSINSKWWWWWQRGAAPRLSFADIAQFLVVTAESNDEVTRRIREADETETQQGCLSSSSSSLLGMDVTKFRPNVVVSGAPGPFDEDFWGELAFGGGGGGGAVRMALTGNCWRCQSITVDYRTGAPAADARGLAWKKLNRDRRVDKGWRHSPVFGRYGFVRAADAGKQIALGDEVVMTRRNRERTVFDWRFPKAVADLYKN